MRPQMHMSYVVVLVCTLLIGTAQAQHPWIIQTGKTAITVEVIKGFFSEASSEYYYSADDEVDGLSSTWHLRARHEVQPGLVIVGDIPFVAYSGTRTVTQYFPTEQTTTYDISGNGFGNIYIGVEAGASDGEVYADAGVLIPAVDYNETYYFSLPGRPDNDKEFAMLNARLVERSSFGTYMDNYIVLSGGVNWEPRFFHKPWHVRARFGLRDFYPHREDHYYSFATLTGGVTVRYNFPVLSASIAYGGLLLGLGGESPKDMLFDYLALGISVPVDQFDIGIVYRAPLRDAMFRTVTDVIHFALTYNIKR